MEQKESRVLDRHLHSYTRTQSASGTWQTMNP